MGKTPEIETSPSPSHYLYTQGQGKQACCGCAACVLAREAVVVAPVIELISVSLQLRFLTQPPSALVAHITSWKTNNRGFNWAVTSEDLETHYKSRLLHRIVIRICLPWFSVPCLHQFYWKRVFCWVATYKQSCCKRLIQSLSFVPRQTKVKFVTEKFVHLFNVPPKGAVDDFLQIFHHSDFPALMFCLYPWTRTRRKALQAALVDPDVTAGVMDGCGPAAAATTRLFLSAIVWSSVIAVCVAGQQSVSCAHYPLAHKRKKGACVSSLSTCPSTE